MLVWSSNRVTMLHSTPAPNTSDAEHDLGADEDAGPVPLGQWISQRDPDGLVASARRVEVGHASEPHYGDEFFRWDPPSLPTRPEPVHQERSLFGREVYFFRDIHRHPAIIHQSA